MKLRHAVVLMLWICSTAGILAQEQFKYDAEADRQFNAALKLFSNSNYVDAARAFDALAQRQPLHQRTTAAFLMSAKSYMQLREYSQAAPILRSFLQRFPSSDYCADAHHTLGLSMMMVGEYRDAAREFLRAKDISSIGTISEEATSMLEFVIDRHLSVDDVRGLSTRTEHQDTRDLLVVKIAEKYLSVNDRPRAQQLLETITKREQVGRYTTRAQSLLARMTYGVSVRIGVMLPLLTSEQPSGVKSLAEEILDGINFSLDEFKSSSSGTVRVSVEVRDTERDTSLAKKALEYFAADKDVVAIIGPLFSNAAFACAPIVKSVRLPMISPTANTNGIAAASPYMFQANPDLATHGKAIARYAVTELQLHTLAVISPDDPMTKMQVEGFTSEAKRLGANVIAVEYYAAGSGDIQEQFMNLRRIAIPDEPQIVFSKKLTKTERARLVRAGANRILLDSLVAQGGSIEAKRLLGPRWKRIADSLKIKYVLPGAHAEELEVPVTQLDGLFAPISNADDIGVIPSQVLYHNIKTQLLGSGEWYDPGRLEANKRFLRDVVFSSDTYIDESDSAYIVFKNMFVNLMKKNPTKYTLFGYDTMKLLLGLLEKGSITREALARSLNTTGRFRGLHTTISFDRGRVNRYMHILRFSKGEITKVAGIEIQ